MKEDLLRAIDQFLNQNVPDEDSSLADKVAFGQALWAAAARIQQGQERVKPLLRQEALAIAGGQPGQVVLDARCTVTIPAATLRLKEGVSEKILRERLGEATFQCLFRTTTQVFPRENFAEELASKPETVVAILAELTDLVTDPPRVSF